jgi:hypothetical protein
MRDEELVFPEVLPLLPFPFPLPLSSPLRHFHLTRISDLEIFFLSVPLSLSIFIRFPPSSTALIYSHLRVSEGREREEGKTSIKIFLELSEMLVRFFEEAQGGGTEAHQN